MLDLFFLAFVGLFFLAGFKRPFLLVLVYAYIDIVAPQKVAWGILTKIPISLIAFTLAFGAWVLLDDKRGTRLSFRQLLMIVLLAYCGITTLGADFPAEAAEKWSWVWKALLFAIFLPLTLRTRLRIEALALVMVLSIAVIVIGGGIKTLAGGGGYQSLKLLVNDNNGLYEGSIISCVAFAVIPLIAWLVRHGTVFPRNKAVLLFAIALSFACFLMPIGTQARTGLVCGAVLALLSLRTVKNRFLYVAALGAAALIVTPLLPDSFTKRMSTIESHKSDQSASTRVAVWKWTIAYVKANPLGGGFEVYRQNKLVYETVNETRTEDNNVSLESETIVEEGRAFHSSYFEMLGEQGFPGLALWLMLHGLGVWQMEILRSRYRKREEPDVGWIAPLANSLQQAQIVYLVGSLFVGIAFQPFCYMLVGLQCGLWTYVRRLEKRPVAVPAAASPVRRAGIAPA
jgi:probable O-glycosylation ligase (exosortase A-associated)